MANSILDLLHLIYPADDARATAVAIDAMLAAAQTPGQAAPATLFSERDVILITYGDSLQRSGEPPLRVLNRFAVERLTEFVSTIHILPFFPYSSDDGFSIMDFYAVNPALGDWPDVEALGHNFELMFDAVFNHMSAQSDWFERFLAREPEFADLFFEESPDTDLSGVTRPRTSPLLTPFTRPDKQVAHIWTTFSADQVDFNAAAPRTLLRLLEILLFYVQKGASIIRLDAIAYLWKEPGTPSIHLPQTHQIIQLMRAALDQVAPHVILITETNVPHSENVSYFGDGANEAQMVYNFTLPPLLFHSFLAQDASKLRRWINTLETPSDKTTFFNFTASHDGIGVRPVEGILDKSEIDALIAHVESRGGRVSYKQNPDGGLSPYELNCGYVDALTDPAESEDMQVKRFLASQAIAMVIAGVPAVYIHSLLGSHNDIAGMEASGANRSINREKLDANVVEADLENPETFRARIFAGYAALLKARINQPAFHPNASQRALDLDNDGVVAVLRTSVDPPQKILALVNITADVQTIDLGDYASDHMRDTITGNPLAHPVVTPPYGVYFMTLPV